MFNIDVKCMNRRGDMCFGFSNISEFSDFYGEAEVLFNPLNSFKII
mgnify:CR=1 FL=1